MCSKGIGIPSSRIYKEESQGLQSQQVSHSSTDEKALAVRLQAARSETHV
jgi:hypothetical protein